MMKRVLGRTGVQVSRFGLGTMVLGVWGNRDRAACLRIINHAIDAGINLVDTADIYGQGENEEIVGEALRGRRDEVFLATKFHNPMGEPDVGDAINRRGNSRRWINTAIDDSLRRLGVDHIDLYQIHRPDPLPPIDETVGALDDLDRAGPAPTAGFALTGLTGAISVVSRPQSANRAPARSTMTPAA